MQNKTKSRAALYIVLPLFIVIGFVIFVRYQWSSNYGKFNTSVNSQVQQLVFKQNYTIQNKIVEPKNIACSVHNTEIFRWQNICVKDLDIYLDSTNSSTENNLNNVKNKNYYAQCHIYSESFGYSLECYKDVGWL